jgi:UDP-glucose 4-epimerase
VRYLVTGGSGYIGSRLVEHLSGREETERIVIADIREPAAFRPRTEYRKLDVRDRAAVRALLGEEQPDTVVHLAFVFNPIHDEALMYEVDVTGTQYVLDESAAAGVGHVLVTSSAVAYGAFADNPVPLTEEDPVRGVPDFSYARDKAESDRVCQLWALKHPDRVMTIVRPTIVFAPEVDNFIVKLWLKQPFHADMGMGDPPLQFVHAEDLVEALTLLLEGRHGGIYNVAPDGYVTIGDASHMLGLKTRRVPFKAYKRLAAALWKARLSVVPEGQLEFAVHPWVISNEKLKQTTGWQPRWTSREVFELTMRAKGKIPAGA